MDSINAQMLPERVEKQFANVISLLLNILANVDIDDVIIEIG